MNHELVLGIRYTKYEHEQQKYPIFLACNKAQTFFTYK